MAKNHTAIGRKTNPKWCASVSIMKKLIFNGSVTNLEKTASTEPRTPYYVLIFVPLRTLKQFLAKKIKEV